MENIKWRILLNKHEENKQLGRRRRRWKVNIKVDPPEVEWESV